MSRVRTRMSKSICGMFVMAMLLLMMACAGKSEGEKTENKNSNPKVETETEDESSNSKEEKETKNEKPNVVYKIIKTENADGTIRETHTRDGMSSKGSETYADGTKVIFETELNDTWYKATTTRIDSDGETTTEDKIYIIHYANGYYSFEGSVSLMNADNKEAALCFPAEVEGVSWMYINKYDENGLLQYRYYYPKGTFTLKEIADLDGMLVNGIEPINVMEFKYKLDKYGNIIEEVCETKFKFDANGNVTDEAGEKEKVEYKLEVDEYGNITRQEKYYEGELIQTMTVIYTYEE